MCQLGKWKIFKRNVKVDIRVIDCKRCGNVIGVNVIGGQRNVERGYEEQMFL